MKKKKRKNQPLVHAKTALELTKEPERKRVIEQINEAMKQG